MNAFLRLLIIYFLTSVTYARPISIAISSNPNNLSPFFSTDANSQNINRLIHTSLIDFDRNMAKICQLCESFKEVRTKDSYKIIFKLKEGVLFSNSKEVTAEDVKKSHRYFTETDKIKSIFRFAFAHIKEVVVKDKYTVELHYKKFGLDHLPNLVLLKIISIPEFDKLKNVEAKDIIGAGDYSITSIAPLEIKMKANKRGLSDLDFIVVKDETTLSLKLIKGEIDLSIATISPRKINYLINNSDVTVTKVLGTDYNYIGINQRKDYLSNKNIRKGLSHLINRHEIIKYKFKSNAVASNGLFAKSFKEYHLDNPVDEFNVKKAQDLFIKANFVKKNGDWYTDKGRRFELTWKTGSNKFQMELVTIMKSEFEKFGIRIHLVPQEWGTFLKGIKRGEYDLYIGRWVGFTGQDMLKFAFSSKNMPPKGANRVFFENQEFDNYVEKADMSLNKINMVKYYKLANKVVNDEYAYISLWHPHVNWVMNKCIKLEGIYPNGNFLALRNLKNDCKI